MLSYFFCPPLCLCVSAALIVIKTISPSIFDFRVGRNNPGKFGAVLTSCLSGHSGSSMLLLCYISDSSSAARSPSLSFGISKSPFQCSPVVSVRNVFRCAILVPFDWMTLDSPNMTDIQDLRSSSRQFVCRQSWWQRWSSWQFKCSRTIMLKEWPGCFDDLFRVQNVSYSGHLLVLSAGVLLCST